MPEPCGSGFFCAGLFEPVELAFTRKDKNVAPPLQFFVLLAKTYQV